MKNNVVIVKDLKVELAEKLTSLKSDKRFILTDTNTLEHCYPHISAIAPIQDARLITIPAGDIHKRLTQVSHVWDILSSEGASRHSLLINLGGGMVTDLGGFAGATFKRGIHTLNIPTTLMACVDAAIGGKTGINYRGLKNEIGAFHQPDCVMIDCRFLQTLDRDNLLSGYAEMMKHGLISSEQTYAHVLSFDLDAAPIDLPWLSRLVEESIEVKKRIVAADPTERGLRKALNFGHTVGHAIESLSFETGRPLLHGHAVAIGMICELYLSYKQCGFPSDKLTRMAHYIKAHYPSFAFDCMAYDPLYEWMTHDKKNENGIVKFTLLGEIGDVRIDQEVDRAVLFEAFDFYRETCL
jgi:3-dehydroquinate synthase